MRTWTRLFVVLAGAWLGLTPVLRAANQISVPLVPSQASGAPASSANPFGVLGPGDLVSGGQLLEKRAGDPAVSTRADRTLTPADRVTGGRVLPGNTIKASRSSNPIGQLTPADLVTGGRQLPSRRP